MKICKNCGTESNENAAFCMKCGYSLSGNISNDAPSGGLAVLSFFFPIIGIILWLAYSRSPQKAKSCGKGAVAGLITGVVLFIILLFLTPIITTAINISENNRTSNITSSDTYVGEDSQYSFFTNIGQIRTNTKDAVPGMVVVDMVIGYDSNDNSATREINGRLYELRDFVRTFFRSKTALELKPENEAVLKQEIIELLNTQIFSTAKIRMIIFNQLDVIDM
jgi:flagellar FliL protein